MPAALAAAALAVPSPPPPSPPPPLPPAVCAAGGASHQTLDCDTVGGVFTAVGDTHIGAIAGTGGYLEVLDGSFTIYSQYTVDLQVRVSNAGDWITVDTISCSSGCGAIETKFSYGVNHHHAVYAADSVWRFFFTCTGGCGPNNRVVVCNPEVCLRPNSDAMHLRPPMSAAATPAAAAALAADARRRLRRRRSRRPRPPPTPAAALAAAERRRRPRRRPRRRRLAAADAPPPPSPPPSPPPPSPPPSPPPPSPPPSPPPPSPPPPSPTPSPPPLPPPSPPPPSPPPSPAAPPDIRFSLSPDDPDGDADQVAHMYHNEPYTLTYASAASGHALSAYDFLFFVPASAASCPAIAPSSNGGFLDADHRVTVQLSAEVSPYVLCLREGLDGSAPDAAARAPHGRGLVPLALAAAVAAAAQPEPRPAALATAATAALAAAAQPQPAAAVAAAAVALAVGSAALAVGSASLAAAAVAAAAVAPATQSYSAIAPEPLAAAAVAAAARRHVQPHVGAHGRRVQDERARRLQQRARGRGQPAHGERNLQRLRGHVRPNLQEQQPGHCRRRAHLLLRAQRRDGRRARVPALRRRLHDRRARHLVRACAPPARTCCASTGGSCIPLGETCPCPDCATPWRWPLRRRRPLLL